MNGLNLCRSFGAAIHPFGSRSQQQNSNFKKTLMGIGPSFMTITLVTSSKSPFAVKLLAFLHRRGTTFVKIGREIIEVHALRTFLRSLHANKGKGDVAGRHLANKFVSGQPEEALRHFVGRYDRSAGIHRH